MCIATHNTYLQAISGNEPLKLHKYAKRYNIKYSKIRSKNIQLKKKKIFAKKKRKCI